MNLNFSLSRWQIVDFSLASFPGLLTPVFVAVRISEKVPSGEKQGNDMVTGLAVHNNVASVA